MTEDAPVKYKMQTSRASTREVIGGHFTGQGGLPGEISLLE